MQSKTVFIILIIPTNEMDKIKKNLLPNYKIIFPSRISKIKINLRYSYLFYNFIYWVNE